MKCVYKIGRLYVVSLKLFDSFHPFIVEDLQCDDQGKLFYNTEGQPVEKPASFHADQNVLFLDFSFGDPDYIHGKKISTQRGMTVWKIGDSWVYSYEYAKSQLEITADYVHATCYLGYPENETWTANISQSILMAVQCRLIMLGYLIVHASCIEIEGKAVLFSAPSGVGKSTRADRWIEEFGASFISGDRPIIDPIRCKALGAPWDGNEKIHRNIEAPIAVFNCIERAEHTKFTHMTAEEKKRYLITQTFIPMWDPILVNKVLAGIREMSRNVSMYMLACDQTITAARECHDILFPKEPDNIIELVKQLKVMDTPKDEYRIVINRFLDFKARKLGVPLSGMFELTPLCNLNCKMCYVHLQKDQLGRKELMSAMQWKNIIKEAHDAGMKFARLTGGECLTYPDFDEIFLYLQSLGIETTVLTNGLLLTEDRIAFFKKFPARTIQVTLYGSNDDVYESVTGVRCFEKVYQNIMSAKEAGLPVVLSITPNAFAYEDIPNIIDLAEEMGLFYNVNPMLFKPRENTERGLYDLTDEQYVEVFGYLARKNSKLLQPTAAEDLPDQPTDGEEDIGVKCGAGRSGFAVSWDGKLMPCINLSGIYEPIVEEGFDRLWKKINRRVNELQLPRECGACAYRLQCEQCIGIHYDPEKIGECNKAMCRRTRLFVEAGLYIL